MKGIFFKFIIASLLFVAKGNAQITGCTDPLSKNYNPKATVNDGSCSYRKTRVKPEFSKELNEKLRETSGLIAWKGHLWTHNDDKDTNLYCLDTISGEIKKTYELKNAVNKDWEEISQDSSYLYIGDFGNNSNGSRNDLHILRIEKNSLLLNPIIDTISFSYSDQDMSITSKTNQTDFDGEAFIVSKDRIYIFTKQWKSKGTGLYVLPKTPGSHVATLKATQDVKGLITGASFMENEKVVVLCGYTKKLKPFLYLLYDYKDSDFFTGNKRRIKLQLPYHQIEGIATLNGLQFYLTNEKFSVKPFVNKSQKLHKVDLGKFLKKVPKLQSR